MAGNDGPRGPKGDRGDVGVDGKAGLQGIRGHDGHDGPRGLVGEKGDAGLKGTGVSIKGTVANVIDLQGQTAAVGEVWFVSANHHIYVKGSDGNWSWLGYIEGPQGKTGPQGPEGPTAVSIDAPNMAKISVNDSKIFVQDAPDPDSGRRDEYLFVARPTWNPCTSPRKLFQ